MICWGIVMTCQGLVRDYHELLVTRILLGLFESGFFPAVSGSGCRTVAKHVD